MKTITATLALMLLLASLAVGCGDDDSDATATPSPTGPATETTSDAPSATTSIEDVIGAAYLEYWDVYAESVFELDESRLGDVMTGAQLQRTLDEIDALRQQGKAAKIVVEHHFAVLDVDANAGSATVRDTYTNNSYEVDAQTKEAVGDPATGTRVTDNYFLIREGETWKVQDGRRESN